MWFLSLILIVWWFTSIGLDILNHPCISGANLAGSWWMIFLVCCWTWWLEFSYEHLHVWSSGMLHIVILLVCDFFCFWYQSSADIIERASTSSATFTHYPADPKTVWTTQRKLLSDNQHMNQSNEQHQTNEQQLINNNNNRILLSLFCCCCFISLWFSQWPRAHSMTFASLPLLV